MTTDVIVAALIESYPDWPTAALSEAILRCHEIQIKHSPKTNRTKITFVVDTTYIETLRPQADIGSEIGEGGHDPMDPLLATTVTVSTVVPTLMSSQDVETCIDGVCTALMNRSHVTDLVRYISNNMSFHMGNRTTHIHKMLQEMGALFIRGPVWYNLMQVRRVDIVGLTCASLRQLLGVTTNLSAHIQLTKVLTSESFIDGNTALGNHVARAFLQTCTRATTDALISIHLSRADCEDKVVENSCGSDASKKRPVSMCIASPTGWHLVLLKDYDLLFIWLALLFDFHTLYWNTTSDKWGSDIKTSPVPTLMSALKWKEEHNTE